MKVEGQKVEESATEIGLIKPSCSDFRLQTSDAIVDPGPLIVLVSRHASA